MQCVDIRKIIVLLFKKIILEMKEMCILGKEDTGLSYTKMLIILKGIGHDFR